MTNFKPGEPGTNMMIVICKYIKRLKTLNVCLTYMCVYSVDIFIRYYIYLKSLVAKGVILNS